MIMDPGILIPVKGYGGHERLVEMFAKEYTNLGHQVSLLVTENSYVENCTVYSLGKEGFPPPKKDRNKTMLTAWKFLWKHRNNFDLVHNFGRLLYNLKLQLQQLINNLVLLGKAKTNLKPTKYFSKMAGCYLNGYKKILATV